MKVLQLANDYFGTDLYARLFSCLESEGIENKIFVPVTLKEHYRKDGNVCAYPCFNHLDRLLFFNKQRKMVRAIEQEYEHLRQFDVSHAHTVFSGGYTAYQLYKNCGIPYIVAVRNTDVSVFFKYMLHLRKIGVEILRNAKKVVFLSPAYQEAVLREHVPERYQVEIWEKSVIIPNGISELFLKNRDVKQLSDVNPIRLLYVGEINKNKNLELTIQSVDLLRKEGLDLSLHVVGEIKEQKYQKIIGESDFVEYHQKCPQEEVLRHMRESDIFAMLSHTETFGLVYAEAMSQGLPVLYTRGQGFDGHFPDGTVGYAVSDTDPRELADKIKMTMENYGKLSGNCVRLVDCFDWKLIAKNYCELYDEIMGGETL